MIITDLSATASTTIKYLLSVKITYIKICKKLDSKGLARIEITRETKIFCEDILSLRKLPNKIQPIESYCTNISLHAHIFFQRNRIESALVFTLIVMTDTTQQLTRQ
jgi:hypothetical protein